MPRKQEDPEEGRSDEFDDVYDEEDLDDLEENDEISPEEEAFMKGYDKKKKKH